MNYGIGYKLEIFFPKQHLIVVEIILKLKIVKNNPSLEPKCSYKLETDKHGSSSVSKMERPKTKINVETSTEEDMMKNFHRTEVIQTPQTRILRHLFVMKIYGKRVSRRKT